MASVAVGKVDGLSVLQQPYSPRDLARKVRETLDQRVHLSAQK
jgi:hypothetical protein